MVDALGNPLATDLSSKFFAHYRDKRLTGEIYFSDKWKKATINLEQSYLSSVFSELARLGEWTAPNPLESMRKFTIAEKEMAWWAHEQITEPMPKRPPRTGRVNLPEYRSTLARSCESHSFSGH
jgi:hypothetical protein